MSIPNFTCWWNSQWITRVELHLMNDWMQREKCCLVLNGLFLLTTMKLNEWNTMNQQITSYFSPSLALFSHHCSLSLSHSLYSSLDHHRSFSFVDTLFAVSLSFLNHVRKQTTKCNMFNINMLINNEKCTPLVLISTLENVLVLWMRRYTSCSCHGVCGQPKTSQPLSSWTFGKYHLGSRDIFATWSYRTRTKKVRYLYLTRVPSRCSVALFCTSSGSTGVCGWSAHSACSGN